MSNANTIRRQVSGSQALTLAPIASQTGAVTNNFVLNANGAIPTNPYAGEASPVLSGGVQPLVAGATGLWLGTGAVMHIRATGTFVTADSSSSLALTLWEVPASIVSAGGLTQSSQTGFNSLAAPSAVVPGAAGTFSFKLDARLQLDGAGGLTGQYWSQIYDTESGSSAGLLTATTAVTGLTEADLNFVLSATSIASHAITAVTLDEFAIDVE